jgi:hypothetical protein
VTVIRFLPLTLTLRDAALVDAGSDPVAPVTSEVVPGTTVRGLLNRACGADAEQRRWLIESGKVQAAPAFPVVNLRGSEGSRLRPAHPAPLVLAARATDDDSAEIIDPRMAGAGDIAAVRGLAVQDDGDWYRAVVATCTEQRLRRNRAGTVAEGAGPFAQTVLEPGQRFVCRLRIVADDDAEAEMLAHRVAAAVLPTTAAWMTIGGGADNAYGGDVDIALGTPDEGACSDVLESLRIDPGEDEPPFSEAGDNVDLVLHSPALLRDPTTGALDPDGLAAVVQSLLDEVLGAGAATVGTASLSRHVLGGFHGLYRGLRPEQWAAAAGSGVGVHLHRDVDPEEWTELLAHRVGERVVDGLGLLALVTRRERAHLMKQPARHDWSDDHGDAVRLPTGELCARTTADGVLALYRGGPASDVATWQLARLQDRLLWERAAEIVVIEARGLVLRSSELPPRHLLGALREAAASTGAPGAEKLDPIPPALAGLLPDVGGADEAAFEALSRFNRELHVMTDDRNTDAGRRTTTPARRKFDAARLDGSPLLGWLQEHARPTTAVAVRLVEDLQTVVLWRDDPDTVVAAWADKRAAALTLLALQALLDRLVREAPEQQLTHDDAETAVPV